MAERKFLFISDDGYNEEQNAADTITVGGLTSTGNIDLSSTGKLVNVVAASAVGDALVYGQSSGSLAGLTLTNDLAMGSNSITGLASPSADNDATNKAYVDGLIQGIKAKDSVRVATTAAGTLASDFEATDTVDGITLVAGDRILIKNQAAASENGIYIVQATGAPTRASDLDTGNSAAAAFVFVEEGTTNADSGWLCTSDVGSDVVGTDSLAWTQFSGAGQIAAGDGLSKTGNTLDVKAGDGIEIASDYVAVDLAASNPGLQLSGTTPNKELAVLPDGTAGIEVGSSGVAVILESDGAIVFDGVNGGLEINLETTNPTLEISTNKLGVKYGPTTSGLTQDISGLAVSVDGTTIDIDGSGELYAVNDLEAEKIVKSYTATEGLTIGDPVYFDSTNDSVSKADASVKAESYVVGVALSTVTAANPIEVVHTGVAEGVLTGATAGTRYFLNSGGGLTTSVPTGTGNTIIEVGIAINATDLLVKIQSLGRRA